MFLGLSLLDPSLRLLLTRHAANGMPLSAVFVGKPLEMAAPSDPQDCDLLKDCLDLVDCLHQHHCTHLNDCLHLTARFARLDLNTRLNAAFIGRDVQTLFDEVLEELSLIPYHVGHWSEISDLLTRVSTPKG